MGTTFISLLTVIRSPAIELSTNVLFRTFRLTYLIPVLG